jgi:hypothetical protein
MGIVALVLGLALVAAPAWGLDGVWSVREESPLTGQVQHYYLSLTTNQSHLPTCDCNTVSFLYPLNLLGVGLFLIPDFWQNNLYRDGVLVGRMFLWLRFGLLEGTVQYEDGTYADLILTKAF